MILFVSPTKLSDSKTIGPGGQVYGECFDEIVIHSEVYLDPKNEDWINVIMCRLAPGGKLKVI